MKYYLLLHYFYNTEEISLLLVDCRNLAWYDKHGMFWNDII